MRRTTSTAVPTIPNRPSARVSARLTVNHFVNQPKIRNRRNQPFHWLTVVDRIAAKKIMAFRQPPEQVTTSDHLGVCWRVRQALCEAIECA